MIQTHYVRLNRSLFHQPDARQQRTITIQKWLQTTLSLEQLPLFLRVISVMIRMPTRNALARNLTQGLKRRRRMIDERRINLLEDVGITLEKKVEIFFDVVRHQINFNARFTRHRLLRFILRIQTYHDLQRQNVRTTQIVVRIIGRKTIQVCAIKRRKHQGKALSSEERLQ